MTNTTLPRSAEGSAETSDAPEADGFEITVLSEPYAEIAVPVPGGCNSSSNSSCSNS